MKALIEDATTEQFKAWADSMLSNDNPDETGFHSGAAFEQILTHMAESEAFKHYLHSGYEAFLSSSMQIVLYGHPQGLPEPIALECLRHDRITAGFMMGFKYAMYLHEQRELQKFADKLSQDN